MMTDQFATKADLTEICAEIRTEIILTRETLRSELATMQNRIIMWLIGTEIAAVGLILAVIKLGH